MNKASRLFSAVVAVLCFFSAYFYAVNSVGIEIDFSSRDILGFNWRLGLCGAGTLAARCFYVLLCLNGLLIFFFSGRPDLVRFWRWNNRFALGFFALALGLSSIYLPIAIVLCMISVPALFTILLYALVSRKWAEPGASMGAGWTNLACVLTAVVLGGGLYAVRGDLAFSRRGETASASSAGSDFSSFSTVDFDGETVTQDLFKGHTLTVLNVWGTFCGPCIIEMPALEALHQSYEPSEVQIVGLCSDITDKNGKEIMRLRQDADRILKQTGVTYRNLYPDKELQNGILRRLLGVPTTFFIDENGKILNTVIGARSSAQWSKLIDAQLKVLAR